MSFVFDPNEVMIDIRTIKLVVWDLDDTFWMGTLSEGPICCSDANLSLVRELTDCGIVNSICSKNDLGQVERQLEEIGIRDLFVFISVDWSPKGMRLKSLLEAMSLRPANVLFIDDNSINIEEVRSVLPDVQLAFPSVIKDLVEQLKTLPHNDTGHRRLSQYKLLEKQNQDKKSYSSNLEFLRSCNIQVQVGYDCLEHIDRIHELIQRSNQLNFTKKRDSIDELELLFHNPDARCGYINVKDKYGDHGIVGFYALSGGELVHFVFSCRILGLGVEQYVYGQLDYPRVNVVGEVRSELRSCTIPDYINACSAQGPGNEPQFGVDDSDGSVLLKGPCDLSHSLMYIRNSERLDAEFTFVISGTNRTVDEHNHSVNIRNLVELSADQFNSIVEECPFLTPLIRESRIFQKKYDCIFLSSLVETVRGVYRKKGTDIKVVYGQRDYPLTDEKNWDGYIDGSIYNSGVQFTREGLARFSELYEFVGCTTPEDYARFLQWLLTRLGPDTQICVILGSTFVLPGCEEHAHYHYALNEAVKALSAKAERLSFIEMDSLARVESDYVDGIDHFAPRVYYSLAGEISDHINRHSALAVNQSSKIKVYVVAFLDSIKVLVKKIVGERRNSWMKRLYHYLTGKRNNLR